jgi:tRNA threonylcarbamoyladenosine biosynthesis protein TsaB
MRILIIDTCGSTGSVAMAETGTEPAIVVSGELPGRTASERLLPTIRELAGSCGFALGALEAVVIVHGPGSFTGVRVGLSAAKGLCHALNLPLIGISRLAILAHMAGAAPGRRVNALLDAGRGEFYSGLYADGVRLREALVRRDEVLADAGAMLLGEGGEVESAGQKQVEQDQVVVTCEPAVAESVAALAPLLLAEPAAADALPLAVARIDRGDFDDVATLDANYLRRTDAELFARPNAKPGAASGLKAMAPAPAASETLDR